MAFKLNANFISNIHDIYGEEGKDWLNNLPSIIAKLCDKWGLRFIEAMPYLTYNFVGLVEILKSSDEAIIKISPTSYQILNEGKWLASFNKDVPKIYWLDEEYDAFLMERIVPGIPLKKMVEKDDDKATRIICSTISDLQSHQQKELKFKHLSEHASSFEILQGHIDKMMLSQAISWFQDLTSDRQYDVLLHGDLHHDNILSSGEEWKVIDPHGYVGDPVFEVGPMIYNPGDCFPDKLSISQTIERRLKILAEELPFDAKRIKAWTYCMTILSIAWTMEGHQNVPEFELNVASIINNVAM